jgi:hypothetical protein
VGSARRDGRASSPATGDGRRRPTTDEQTWAPSSGERTGLPPALAQTARQRTSEHHGVRVRFDPAAYPASCGSDAISPRRRPKRERRGRRLRRARRLLRRPTDSLGQARRAPPRLLLAQAERHHGDCAPGSVVEIVRTGSEFGVEEGGCSPTRAGAGRACKVWRIRPAASTPATLAIAAKEASGVADHDA